MLKDKCIVIIGGTSGIGLAAAHSFLENGAKLIITGKEDTHLEKINLNNNNNCIALALDATIEGSAEHAINQCVEEFGCFDALYHVAGGSGRSFGDGPLHELTLEGWEKTMQLNLTTMMMSNRAAIKKLLSLDRKGSILNMGSVLAFDPSPQFFYTHAYAAAKSAAIGFTKSIASYYSKYNIRVNLIAPGLVETPMSQRAINDEDIMNFISQKQPLDGGRIGKPADLCGLSALLMSDAASFITGQVIAVDGGWSIS